MKPARYNRVTAAPTALVTELPHDGTCDASVHRLLYDNPLKTLKLRKAFVNRISNYDTYNFVIAFKSQHNTINTVIYVF